ncbi:TerC family protein [Flagellimonas zhangzhouensis]|uniref:Membrane protein TerC, possibly involved in tellurium resistance n=1 Tax=Flagellimonas zhangzhouensis TaxID=1073328 RepID=A0A1H2SQ13_9FLAO|nr:TerC family protein [Allomuricauda zhangzhouensis]SDQ77565.1 Membrane protein TerC, possibly involved in tellurium resistance [Allomuricauda zhangzhouensis]SDW33555.1 Membrane protein TerC, possibly involved in tellurium resistance [Allomuricauda zhangzhouensis]
MFDIFASPDAWMALLTLTFLEIVLGIDNIIFISIAAGKLEKKNRRKATNIGLLLAMVMRIILLFGITWLTKMKKPFLVIDESWITGGISWQAIILFGGGLFLLYKSTHEIHEKIEDRGHDEREVAKSRSSSLMNAIVQITVINIVFSFDSILTAIGMTNGISPNPNDALILMITAVVISVLIMMLFANPVGEFVNNHPSIQVLGLSFLILIGFMLIAESAHLSHLVIFDNEVGAIPKGYLYFAIAFSLMVEFINLRIQKKHPQEKESLEEH